MDFKILLSVLSLISVYVYLHIGLYTLKQNRRAVLNRVFFLLCLSYGFWSLAYSFAYISETKHFFSVWNKLSAVGWCTFSALSLHIVLLLTENRFCRSRLTTVLLYIPSAVFLYMTLFLFGPDIQTPAAVSTFFYTGDFLYNSLYNIGSMLLLVIWGLRSDSLRVKKQSRILVFSSLASFSLTLLTQTLLPMAGFDKIPPMGQIFAVISILGTYIVITKYKMLLIPRNIILNEVEKKIIELVILLNHRGEFLQISDHALKLLDYEDHELLGKNITHLFGDEDTEKFSIDLLKQEIEYNDVQIFKKNKEMVPVQIMCVPIIDDALQEFLGALLVIRDIRKEYELRAMNAELHERTIRDSLTNLYNHQHSLELLNQEIEKLKDLSNQALSVMMLDIDYFKRINDTYGHLYGDGIIKAIASILTANAAGRGLVGRFGGEEFIVILPGIGTPEACRIGEAIRSEVCRCDYPESLGVTISIGIAQCTNETSMQLLKKADDFLYKAKQNGRNRIESDYPTSSVLSLQ